VSPTIIFYTESDILKAAIAHDAFCNFTRVWLDYFNAFL